MRREPRPFVVEVRRGPKKPATPAENPFQEPQPDENWMRRAEEALFGRPARSDTPPAAAGEFAQPRRILEVIAPDPVGDPAAQDVPAEPRRRGRKPGSKNKPKEAIAAETGPEKRRRGRPPKNPEALVRKVAVTPELASAALEVMARVTPVTPAARPILAKTEVAPPVKRPRGRPRKVPATPAPAPPVAAVALSNLDTAQSIGPAVAQAAVERFARGAAPRPGRQWTRRLRSFANPDHVKQRLTKR